MLALLPLAALYLLTLIVRQNNPGSDRDWREDVLVSFMVWSVFLVGITEALSVFRALSLLPILFFWSACIVVTAIIVFKKTNPAFPSFSLTKLSWPAIFAVTMIAVILILAGMTAFIAPPNTYDSMTYHMARVVHWAQNKSIDHYATHIPRQIWKNPFAEFVILHFQILTENDRFANMVQWLAFAGCAIATSLMAKLLGVKRPGQIMAALFTVTLPMAIAQGSSTQNDLVTALFLVSFVIFLFKTKSDGSRRWPLLAGAALGLGLLTKGTMYLYAFPFAALFVINKDWQKRFLQIIFIVAVCLLINSGYFIRNYHLGKNILTPHPEGKGLTNSELSWKGTLSNLVKNSAIHLGSNSDKVNDVLKKNVMRIHTLLDLDPSDPRFSLTPIEFNGQSYDEDYAPNPAHFLLFIAASLALLYMASLQRNREWLTYWLGLVLGSVLFCATIKWQPWHSRLHLLFFIPAAPFAASIIYRLLERIRRDRARSVLYAVLTAYLLAAGMPSVFGIPTRRLASLKKATLFNTDRTALYFAKHPDLFFPYSKAAEFIKSGTCRNIGLIAHGESWEYPLWPLLDFGHGYRIEHAALKDPLMTKYVPNDFEPCMIMDISGANFPTIEQNGLPFTRTFRSPAISLLYPDKDGRIKKDVLNSRFHDLIRLLSRPLPEVIGDDNFQNVSDMLGQELFLVEDIDADELEKVLRGLGTSFARSLVPAMHQRYSGLTKRNVDLLNRGNNAIKGWLASYQNQIQAVDTAFQKYLAP